VPGEARRRVAALALDAAYATWKRHDDVLYCNHWK
jgi:hypothetical protein